MSLVARHLEANGIPTVIIGSALDIVEHCGAPRFLFVDFPLGNPCGEPGNTTMQREIVLRGLHLLDAAEAPATTVHTNYAWSGGNSWRKRYMEITDSDREKLARLGDERRAHRQKLRETGQVRLE